MYGARILVEFLRVLVVRQKACMHAIGANDIGQARGLHDDAGRLNAHGSRFGCALEQPTAWSWCLCVVLVANDAVYLPEVSASVVRATWNSSSFSSLVLFYHLLLRCHSLLRRHVSVWCISSCVGIQCDAGRLNAHGYRFGCALEQPAA